VSSLSTSSGASSVTKQDTDNKAGQADIHVTVAVGDYVAHRDNKSYLDFRHDDNLCVGYGLEPENL
jgi:hypothetical protein